MVYGLWIGWATSLIEEVNCVPMKNQEMRGDSYCFIGVKCVPMHEELSKLIVVVYFESWNERESWSWRLLRNAVCPSVVAEVHQTKSRPIEVCWSIAKLTPSWSQAEATPSWSQAEAMKMSQSMWRSTGLGSFTILGWSHGTCRDLCSILQVLAGIVMIMELMSWCQSGWFSYS